jgi:hypothetical protein
VKDNGTEFAAPLGSTSQGRLEFARCTPRVRIEVGSDTQDLFRGRFTGTAPMVLADDGRVTIEYPRMSPSEWFRPNRRAADVALNPTVPWELVFGGGVSALRADLGGLALRSLDILGGGSDITIDLPEPRGVVPLRVGGGASKVVLRRPAGAAASVAIGGGASKVVFDEHRVGSSGAGLRLASPAASEAGDRYEIEIGGGSSELTIVESER